jgi:hypothetical protein
LQQQHKRLCGIVREALDMYVLAGSF